MKRVLIAAVLLVAGNANAGGWSKANSGPVVPTATVSPLSPTPTPACARLQPVVGSVQRKSHFTNPLTHTVKYTYTTYNPIAGQFGTGTFRR